MNLARIVSRILEPTLVGVAGLFCAQPAAAQENLPIDVRSYIPAANASYGYASFLRIINTSSAATPVSVAVIDGATGVIGASGQLTASLPAGAAVTFSAQQVEAALGVSLPADGRPRIRVTTTVPVEVQSFQSNPTGVVAQNADALTGTTSYYVPSYIPAANSASGYASHIRVINVGTLATAIQVTLVDGNTGVAGASGQLTPALPAGGAVTYSARQVEAALGVALPADSRPRILVTGSVPLEVQSFQANPGGVVTQNAGTRAGTSVPVQNYIPSALSVSGYNNFIRVINNGAQATAVGVSLIDAFTGQTRASGQLTAALPANAAVTFSSRRIEEALGVVVDSQDRPRILVTSPSNELSIQSFQSNPGGVVTQNLETRSGNTIDIRSYIPAAMGAYGYAGYVRVINTSGTATPVSVALIDGTTGVAGASRQLIASIAAGGAATFSASQIEAALGGAIPADYRPRLRVTASVPIEVQSFQSSPTGVVVHNGGAQNALASYTSTTGVVIGSYFRNAKVCLDTNANGLCDSGEPAARTNDNGQFTISGTGAAVVAEIGTDAVQYDPDTNAAAPVTARIILRAPKEAPGVVSLHSTAVVSEMESSALAYDAALQNVAAMAGVSTGKLLADFNREANPTVKAMLKSASSDGLKRIQLALGSAKPTDDPRKVLASASGTLDKIKNVVVIYMENRSFDNLYGLFPGANGIANALANPANYQQLDRDGVTVLPTLPTAWTGGGGATWSFVGGLPNKPFRIDAANGSSPGVPLSVVSPDLMHRFYQNQTQIRGGRNNSFAAWSDAGGLVMGYYDGSSMKLWSLAQQYTLADNYFMGAFGGSFLNHFWLVCACTPLWPNPPASFVASVDSSGTKLNAAANSPASARDGPPVYVNDGAVTPRLADGNYYATNTAQPPYQPSFVPPPAGGDPRLADPGPSLPPQTGRTIGDTLTSKQLDWKWYAGNWNLAVSDRTTIGQYEPHHNPFLYFKRFDPTTTTGAVERTAHLKDYADLLSDIQNGSLPTVTFYKPIASLAQHPGEADIVTGDTHVADLVARLQASPQWKNMLIVITYDENGGFWDHVAPPRADQWGPGNRVPAILVSPYAKKGYVDSAPYDTTSIAKFITRRFGLEPLPGARKETSDLSNSLDMSQ